MRGKLRGEWIDAQARIIKDRDSIERAYAALHQKYGWQMRLTDFMSRLFGRIDGREILEIELS